MRSQLEKLGFDKRFTFRGTFERFGYADNPFDPYKKETGDTTLLLTNVQVLKDGQFVDITDHIWLKCGTQFEKIDPQENDILQFDARVSSYYKRDPFNHHEISLILDYRLTRPSKVSNITRPNATKIVESRKELVQRMRHKWQEQSQQRNERLKEPATTRQKEYISAICEHFKLDNPIHPQFSVQQAKDWFDELERAIPDYAVQMKQAKLEKQKQITQERNQRIVEQFNNGESIEMLEKQYHLKSSTIKTIIKCHSI